MNILAHNAKILEDAQRRAVGNFERSLLVELATFGFVPDPIALDITQYPASVYSIHIGGRYKGYQVTVRFTHGGEMVKGIINYKSAHGTLWWRRCGAKSLDGFFKGVDKNIKIIEREQNVPATLTT